MTAIVHDHRLFQETPLLFENSELAARNYPSHYVVSGKKESLDAIEQYLKEKGIIHQSLSVSYGFHSSLIEPAESDCLDLFSGTRSDAHPIPFISCMKTDVIHSIHKDHWWEVVRKPVEFQKTIQTLEERQPYIYLDLGPSGTLANFVRYNLSGSSESEVFHILSPFGKGLQNLGKVMDFFRQ